MEKWLYIYHRQNKWAKRKKDYTRPSAINRKQSEKSTVHCSHWSQTENKRKNRQNWLNIPRQMTSTIYVKRNNFHKINNKCIYVHSHRAHSCELRGPQSGLKMKWIAPAIIAFWWLSVTSISKKSHNEIHMVWRFSFFCSFFFAIAIWVRSSFNEPIKQIYSVSALPATGYLNKYFEYIDDVLKRWEKAERSMPEKMLIFLFRFGAKAPLCVFLCWKKAWSFVRNCNEPR